jgi:hypothetical protein
MRFVIKVPTLAELDPGRCKHRLPALRRAQSYQRTGSVILVSQNRNLVLNLNNLT